MAMTGRRTGRNIPEGFIPFVPRSSAKILESADMVHLDTGAAYNHYSADVQRSMPVDGKFNPKQSRLYEITLDVQKTVISRIKPGVTWWELHNLAVKMLADAGGYDKYYTYGIGHFIGMEVHDDGDYEQPFKPGMVVAIEQGVAPPDGPRVALEDDVLVTENGHEWLSKFIPIEKDEVEAMLAKPSSLAPFVGKSRFSISEEEEKRSASSGRQPAAGVKASPDSK
jgi:Xaa-Pro aminopeptidase